MVLTLTFVGEPKEVVSKLAIPQGRMDGLLMVDGDRCPMDKWPC